MIYLDSSALLKLLVEEAESAALELWMSQRPTTPRISSELAKLDVVRAARRLDPGVAESARGLVAQLDLVPVSGAVLTDAAEVGDPRLRSLDAIHLVSAMSLGPELASFVVYDHRLAAAADDLGLPVSQPGKA